MVLIQLLENQDWLFRGTKQSFDYMYQVTNHQIVIPLDWCATWKAQWQKFSIFSQNIMEENWEDILEINENPLLIMEQTNEALLFRFLHGEEWGHCFTFSLCGWSLEISKSIVFVLVNEGSNRIIHFSTRVMFTGLPIVGWCVGSCDAYFKLCLVIPRLEQLPISGFIRCITSVQWLWLIGCKLGSRGLCMVQR